MGCRQIATEEKKSASSFTSFQSFQSSFAAVWEKLKMKWIQKINLAFSKHTNRNKKTQFFFSFIFQFYLLLLTEVILQTFYNILFRFQLLFFPTSEREMEKIPICCLYIFVYYIFRSQTKKKMLWKSWFILLFFYAKKFNLLPWLRHVW